MNKLLIGLLIVAAGAGVYFLLKKKKEQLVTNTINREWIIGKWETAQQQPVADTVQPAYQYDFQKNGVVLRTLSDPLKADTAHYEWSKENHLVLKQTVPDSVMQTFSVLKLTADSLLVKAADNLETLFTKLK
ncbi:MAG: hypothetical protein ACT4OJ_07930 [Bacteroidota bacterium]